MSEGVHLYGDSIITFSGAAFVLGLDMNEFHTFRFESVDGINYSRSVDGQEFVERLDVDNGGHFVQMWGNGGCSIDYFPQYEKQGGLYALWGIGFR